MKINGLFVPHVLVFEVMKSVYMFEGSSKKFLKDNLRITPRIQKIQSNVTRDGK